MGLALVTAATHEPLSLIEVKTHLRIDHGDEDTLLDSLIATARQYCETVTGRQFVSATWDQTFPRFEDELLLVRPPLSSVTSVKYYDADGVEQTADSSLYDVVTNVEPGRVRLAYDQSWPTTRAQEEPVTVRFVAGYGTADSVPQSLKSAMKLLVGHLYEHRETVALLERGQILAEVPLAFNSLMWAYRMVPV